MNIYLLLLTISINAVSGLAFADCKLEPNANIVMLKLDDVTNDPTGKQAAGVPVKWQKVTDFLESNKIPASYGVIGGSLEADNPVYFTWLRKRVEIGDIELWNHGYLMAFTPNKESGELGEFNGRSPDKQAQSISQTQLLGEKRVGVTFHGFGPHASPVDQNTYPQLDAFPEIQYVWFYKPTDLGNHKPYVFQRVANLENPIFHPNFESFLSDYYKRPQSLGYIAIQGHPNMWDDKGYDDFLRIVRFLQDQGASFCRPSDVLHTQ